MKDLNIGDQVLTSTGYQAIYGQVHDKRPITTEFLQIYTTSYSKPLEITEDHLIYIANRANPVKAGSIKVGDVLQSVCVWDGKDAGASVTKITKILRPSVYAPLTRELQGRLLHG